MGEEVEIDEAIDAEKDDETESASTDALKEEVEPRHNPAPSPGETHNGMTIPKEGE